MLFINIRYYAQIFTNKNINNASYDWSGRFLRPRCMKIMLIFYQTNYIFINLVMIKFIYANIVVPFVSVKEDQLCQ